MRLLTNEICLSCVCAERTSPFSAVAQRLKIGGILMSKDSFRNRKNGFETMDGDQQNTAGKKKAPGRIAVLAAAALALVILLFISAYEI